MLYLTLAFGLIVSIVCDQNKTMDVIPDRLNISRWRPNEDYLPDKASVTKHQDKNITYSTISSTVYKMVPVASLISHDYSHEEKNSTSTHNQTHTLPPNMHHPQILINPIIPNGNTPIIYIVNPQRASPRASSQTPMEKTPNNTESDTRPKIHSEDEKPKTKGLEDPLKIVTGTPEDMPDIRAIQDTLESLYAQQSIDPQGSQTDLFYKYPQDLFPNITAQ